MKVKSPSYRRLMRPAGLKTFRLLEEESDISVAASRDVSAQAKRYLRNCRRQLKEYIKLQPAFSGSFSPVKIRPGAPAIVRSMAEAARQAGVGPMAAVAGAVAEYLGLRLRRLGREVIVENGGDIYFFSRKQRRILVQAGTSVLSRKISLLVGPVKKALGICTSSGTVGPSFSYGLADAVVIIAASAPLADAVATRIGNLVKIKADIPAALAQAKKIKGVLGALIIKDDQLGLWGRIKLAGPAAD